MPMPEWMQAHREEVNEWIRIERAGHADVKYDSTLRDEGLVNMQEQGLEMGGYWDDFIKQYLHRASLFGLETPQGRQALGKAIVTAHACLETAIEAFGPMPTPGVPSGEIK